MLGLGEALGGARGTSVPWARLCLYVTTLSLLLRHPGCRLGVFAQQSAGAGGGSGQSVRHVSSDDKAYVAVFDDGTVRSCAPGQKPHTAESDVVNIAYSLAPKDSLSIAFEPSLASSPSRCPCIAVAAQKTLPQRHRQKH